MLSGEIARKHGSKGLPDDTIKVPFCRDRPDKVLARFWQWRVAGHWKAMPTIM